MSGTSYAPKLRTSQHSSTLKTPEKPGTSIRPLASGNQTKIRLQRLAVRPESDRFEREADQVAESILRDTSEPAMVSSVAAGGDADPISPDVEARVCQVLSGPGEPLSEELRFDLQPRFGFDFGEVRVHRGGAAAASAAAVGARAYTVGSNIVFGEGAFAPETASGRRLLAHELTHVIQQGSAGSAQIQSKKDSSKQTDGKSIHVSLDDQVLTATENGKVVFRFDCVTGQAGYETEPKAYKVLEKDPTHFSKKYHAPMPWSLKFSSDWKAIHATGHATFRSYLKAFGMSSVGSHGCVGLTWEDAKTIYHWARIGTPVIVEAE